MIRDQPSNVFFGGAFNVDGQGAMLISKTQLTEQKIMGIPSILKMGRNPFKQLQ